VRRTQAGDLILLISADDKKFLLKLAGEGELHTHQGILQHESMIDVPLGTVVHSHLGEPFLLLRPTLQEILLNTKRKSQIIFPKDIGYILLRLSIGPGSTVVEAGTGSGALTTALAWAVGPAGRVFSYDSREDMQALARENLERLGLEGRVRLIVRDIEEGFEQRDADAVFLDLPNPHDYLAQTREALCNGGTLGSILPTTNQVAQLVRALREHGFQSIEVCELLLRFYKTLPSRLRPEDRMVAHTGYLIFGRSLHE
jgi:tRNA (adenine57-N1/adenine58-N1)-methyltransferase